MYHAIIPVFDTEEPFTAHFSLLQSIYMLTRSRALCLSCYLAISFLRCEKKNKLQRRRAGEKDTVLREGETSGTVYGGTGEGREHTVARLLMFYKQLANSAARHPFL